MTREQAEAIYALGKEAVVFVMLQMAARLVGQVKDGPRASTPSAMVPTYNKKSKRKCRNNRGAKPGHAGKRRENPPKITRQQDPMPPSSVVPTVASHSGRRIHKDASDSSRISSRPSQRWFATALRAHGVLTVTNGWSRRWPTPCPKPSWVIGWWR